VLEDGGEDRLEGPPMFDQLATELKEIVPQEDNLSCEPESIVEFGVPAKHVLEIGKEIGADLIIMGMRLMKQHPTQSIHTAAFRHARSFRMQNAWF
jgi:nucleotide-binding universal stress UspA family protein